MTDIPLSHILILSAALFSIGAFGILSRRNLIFVLMSLEIMLTAASIAFIAAAAKWFQPDGQIMVILILVVAAAEVAVGLTLVLRLFHITKDTDTDKIVEMKG